MGKNHQIFLNDWQIYSEYAKLFCQKHYFY